MSINTYDPKDLLIICGGYKIDGFAEQQLTISRPNAMFNTQVGATGSVMRVKTNDTTCDVTFTLQQASLGIAALDSFAEKDEGLGNNGVFEMRITYKGSTDDDVLLYTTDAFVEKKPDSSWSNSPNDREFTIKAPNATYKPAATSYIYPYTDIGGLEQTPAQPSLQTYTAPTEE